MVPTSALADRREAGAGTPIANVQALRIFAALLVVLYHCGHPPHGVELRIFPHERPLLEPLLGRFGTFGVDIFFVISGFIMTSTTWRKFGTPGAWRDFLIKRAIRIYPPYWIALVPLVIGSIVSGGHLMRSHVGHAPNFIADVLLVPQTLPTMIVSWTLSYELSFYAVFAAMLLFPSARALPALALWAAVQCVLYAAFHASSNTLLHFAGSLLPLEFIAGAAIGIAFVRMRLPVEIAATMVAAAAFAALWAGVVRFGPELGFASDVPAAVAKLAVAALLVYAAVALETVRAWKAPKLLVALGDASFALYLWHLTLLFAIGDAIGRLHPHGPAAHVASVAAMVAGAVGASTLIYRHVERPLVRTLNRAFATRREQERTVYSRAS